MRTTAGRAARAARTGWGAPRASAAVPQAHRMARVAIGRDKHLGPAGEGPAFFPHSSQVATARLIASREAALAPAATASEQSMWRGKSVAPTKPVRTWSVPHRRAVLPVPTLDKSNAEMGPPPGQAASLATGPAIAPPTVTAAITLPKA